MHCGWGHEAEGRVRPFAVVGASEGVEGTLLCSPIGSDANLELQGAMKALEATILLRLCRCNTLEDDAEAQEPDSESRQARR